MKQKMSPGDSQLPPPAKDVIRKMWESRDSEVQYAQRALAAVSNIWIPIGFSIDWPAMYHAVQEKRKYDSEPQIIEYLVSGIHAWLKVMYHLWCDTSDPEWIKAVEKRIGLGPSIICLKIEVQTDMIHEAWTGWSHEKGSFLITLPVDPRAVKLDFPMHFTKLLVKEFQPSPTSLRPGERPIVAPQEAEQKGTVETVDPKLVLLRGTKKVAWARAGALALPPPSEFFDKPPYHLFVNKPEPNRRSEIRIQSSHTASLKLLSAYTEMWMGLQQTLGADGGRVDEQDPSSWEIGDTIVLRLINELQNPPVAGILALVEGKLGYKLVHSADSHWHYRRNNPFDNSSVFR